MTEKKSSNRSRTHRLRTYALAGFWILQAAVLLEKLEIFLSELENRQTISDAFSERLSGSFHVPNCPDGFSSAWAQYTIRPRKGSRDQYLNRLKDAGIPAAVYYRRPLHLQTAYADLGYGKGDFPIAEVASKEVFSIPMHPYLTREEIDQIAIALGC